jgi:hypothetical protein
VSFSTADTKKKASNTSVSSLSIIPPYHNKFYQRIGNKQKTEESSLHNKSIESGSGHDFQQVRVSAPSGSSLSSIETQSCPLSSTGPRACPFGGACHICPAKIQTKPAINRPGDQYEQEADRIAEQITGMSETQVLRKTEDDRYSQTSVVPDNVDKALSSHRHPLENGIRASMESRFRHDFSNVRVHTDSKAAESAKALNAKAYTLGQDIVFGSGQYQSTTEGKKLLAHELTHVVQQGLHHSATVNRVIRCKPFPGEKAEQETRRLKAIGDTRKAVAHIERALRSGYLFRNEVKSGKQIKNIGASITETEIERRNRLSGLINTLWQMVNELEGGPIPTTWLRPAVKESKGTIISDIDVHMFYGHRMQALGMSHDRIWLNLMTIETDPVPTQKVAAIASDPGVQLGRYLVVKDPKNRPQEWRYLTGFDRVDGPIVELSQDKRGYFYYWYGEKHYLPNYPRNY